MNVRPSLIRASRTFQAVSQYSGVHFSEVAVILVNSRQGRFVVWVNQRRSKYRRTGQRLAKNL